MTIFASFEPKSPHYNQDSYKIDSSFLSSMLEEQAIAERTSQTRESLVKLSCYPGKYYVYESIALQAIERTNNKQAEALHLQEEQKRANKEQEEKDAAEFQGLFQIVTELLANQSILSNNLLNNSLEVLTKKIKDLKEKEPYVNVSALIQALKHTSSLLNKELTVEDYLQKMNMLYFGTIPSQFEKMSAGRPNAQGDFITTMMVFGGLSFALGLNAVLLGSLGIIGVGTAIALGVAAVVVAVCLVIEIIQIFPSHRIELTKEIAKIELVHRASFFHPASPSGRDNTNEIEENPVMHVEMAPTVLKNI